MNNHTIDILKKAFPYLDNKNKSSVRIILKAAELDDAITELNNTDTLSVCDASNNGSSSHRTPNSIETLLKSIRPICYKREQEFIDLIINFTKSQELYNAYKSNITSDTFFGENFQKDNIKQPTSSNLGPKDYPDINNSCIYDNYTYNDTDCQLKKLLNRSHPDINTANDNLLYNNQDEYSDYISNSPDNCECTYDSKTNCIEEHLDNSVNNIPDNISEQFSSLMNSSPDNIKEQLNSLINNSPDNIKEQLNSLINNNPDNIKAQLNSLVNSNPGYIKEQLNSLINNNPDSIKEQLHSLINNSPDSIKEQLHSLINNSPDSIKEQLNSLMNNNPDKIKSQLSSLISNSPDNIREQLSSLFNNNVGDVKDFNLIENLNILKNHLSPEQRLILNSIQNNKNKTNNNKKHN